MGKNEFGVFVRRSLIFDELYPNKSPHNSLVSFVKDRPGHDFRYALNSNKIKNKLRWKSYTKLKKGLEKTFKWYVNNQNYYSKLKKTDITKRLGQKY